MGLDGTNLGTAGTAVCALLAYAICFLKSRARSDLVALRPLAEPLRRAA
jgi:hypothetical protein